MQKPIYLDYNATTPVAKEVLEAMLPWFSEQFGNAASRTHVYGWEAEEAIENAKKQIADTINCEPSEIYFTSGATESNNLAIKGLVENKANKIERIISSKVEHKATLDVCEYLKNTIPIEFLNVDSKGNILLDHLQKNDLDNCLFTLILANNETGNLLDLSKIADLKIKNNFIFHTDATQALGKIPIDFKNGPFDLMSISAHKIYGPKGIGALIIRNGVKIATQMHGGNHQKGVRSGTLNVPGIVGFGKACELSKNNLENYAKEISKLRNHLEDKLLQISGTELNGDKQNRLPNTTNISFAGVDGELLLLNLNKIAVSSGSACTSASVEPSHVLLAMGLSPDLAFSSIRFSLGNYTQSDEIDFAVKHIYEVNSSLKHHV